MGIMNMGVSMGGNIVSYSAALTEPTKKNKPFNIQLSEDDKDIYNVNDEEEEEEEEEEDDEEEQEEKEDTQQDNTKEVSSNNSTTEITNENTVHKEATSNTNDIIDVINTSPLLQQQEEQVTTTTSSSSSEQQPKEEIINTSSFNFDEQSLQSIYQSNLTNCCHRLRKVGTVLHLDEIEYYIVTIMKRKKSLLSKLNPFSSNTPLIPTQYLLFFEEQYLYFIKDEIINKTNKSLRRIKNRFSLYQISQIIMEEDLESENKTSIHFDFIVDKASTTDKGKSAPLIKTKQILINNELLAQFTGKLSELLTTLGINLQNNKE
jgi:hypothetical protein